MGYLRRHWQTFGLIGLFAGMTVLFLVLPLQTIVDHIGSDNAYIIMFVVAMIGGMTTFSGVPYQFLLIGFVHAGMSPIGLGTITAFGIMAGDSTSYLVGRQSTRLFSPRITRALQHIADILTRHPQWVFPSLFLYGSFSPLSNDFIVISLGLARYSYWRTIVPLLLGNIVYHIGIAYLGVFAYQPIMNFFGLGG